MGREPNWYEAPMKYVHVTMSRDDVTTGEDFWIRCNAFFIMRGFAHRSPYALRAKLNDSRYHSPEEFDYARDKSARFRAELTVLGDEYKENPTRLNELVSAFISSLKSAVQLDA